MTADRAAVFQIWHERQAAMWDDMHAGLARLEAERDRQLADVQRQYEQLVTRTWDGFHDKAGDLFELLREQITDHEQQAQADPLPLAAPAPAPLPDPVAPVLGDVRDHLAGGPGPRPGPPWQDAPQPPAAQPPPAGSAVNDSDRQP